MREMNLPNKLTLLRVLMIPLFLALFYFQSWPHHWLAALLVFAAASVTDALDGNIARSRGLVTDFGKFMDPLADKLLVTAALMGFVDGVGGGLFDPDGLVTQQEFCAVMSRVAAYLNCNAASYIADLTEEEAAADTALEDYSAWARTYGYIMDHMMVDGAGNPVSILQVNSRAPQSPILREEAAATLCHLLTMFGILAC